MQSAIIVAKRLVERKLKTLNPAVPTAWENASFTTPVDGSKYIKCSLSISPPDDTCIGNDYYRENARFNIFVLDKLNIGTTGALTTAESIRGLFSKGLTMEEEGIRVRILNTPHIAGAVVTSDRLLVPISVNIMIENM